MIAPATHPVAKPCASPIPIKAIPIVAMVVHELPVITDPSAGVKSIGKTEKISRTKSIKKKKIPFIKY